jgi:hypothetical protein
MQKSFCMHYPTFGATRSRNAITQHSILMDMLTALIKAENNLTNIRNIVRVEQCGGQQFHTGKIFPTMPSVAKKTPQRYADDSTKISHDSRGSNHNNYFGCGRSHPWSKLVDGKYVVICPNETKPGVCKKAESAISKYQSRRRRNAKNNKKQKNLNAVNWKDIPEKRHKVILGQQHALMAVSSSNAASVALSLTGTTKQSAPGIIHRSSVTLHFDVVVLLTQSSKPQIPIAIHSSMPHLTLQMGGPKEERDCPALWCMLDLGTLLSTANFHYMGAVIWQYPPILKAVYLPNDYASIVLSGIIKLPDKAPNTTELLVGFEIFLPYLTKDGNETSLLVAAGPDIAVNSILGLLFIKATGMIADFIDSVCQAKHLLANPFPMDIRRAMKSIPAIWGCGSASNFAAHKKVHQALDLLKAYFASKEEGCPLHLIASLSADQGFKIPPPRKVSFGSCWEPPVKSADHTPNDYSHQVLKDLGYL